MRVYMRVKIYIYVGVGTLATTYTRAAFLPVGKIFFSKKNYKKNVFFFVGLGLIWCRERRERERVSIERERTRGLRGGGERALIGRPGKSNSQWARGDTRQEGDARQLHP